MRSVAAEHQHRVAMGAGPFGRTRVTSGQMLLANRGLDELLARDRRANRMRQVILDTETTGLEVEKGHRVIEIGCVELLNRSDGQGVTFHRYI